MLRLLLLPVLILALLPLKTSLSCTPPPYFYADFSQQTTDVISDFTLTNSIFSVAFTGGYVKPLDTRTYVSIGSATDTNVNSYTDYNWVILPSGTSTKGSSSGEASITMTPAATHFSADLQAGSDVQARAQLLDDQDGLIYEYMFSNGEYLYVNFAAIEGASPVSKLKIIVDGGVDETKLSYFTQHDSTYYDSCGGSDAFGAFNPVFILLLFALLLMIKYNQRAFRRTN